MSTRRVRVVVVNLDGGDLTLACLDSLHRATTPDGVVLEVVLVDNASTDGVADAVESDPAGVRVVRSATNLGFAGGCNLGIGDVDEVDFVALVNPDARVHPEWLGGLVGALDGDAGVGAASPKLLFGSPFRRIHLAVEPAVAGSSRRRSRGVRVSGFQVAGELAEQVQLVEGFGGREPGLRNDEPWYQCVAGTATVHVPVDADRPAPSVRARLGSDRPTRLTATSGARSETLTVSRGDDWYELPLDGEPFDVINNVGTVVLPGGYGADRGFQEPDEGQYERPEDITAWSGGAVLLSARYLADAGRFDDTLFLYYEDLDLALRGARLGWRYRYVPSSVVRHAHSATAVAGSEIAEHYKERNRLAVRLRHGGTLAAARASVRYLVATVAYFRRDVLARWFRGQPARGVIVIRRLRAFGAFLRLAPRMRRSPTGAA